LVPTKVLSNFAFKNIPKNGQKPFIFSFCIPVQNLCRIFSWSLKQSCGGLNSKQLSFLGHFQKMPFSYSKFGLKLLFEIYLKIEIEKNIIFTLPGCRLPSRPKPICWPRPTPRSSSRSPARGRARLPRLPGRHAATVHRRRGAVPAPTSCATFKSLPAAP
jgi:hypothetical protein